MSIKKCFENILDELDKDKIYINKEVFENTPKRIEDFYKEVFSGMKIDPYSFLKNSLPSSNNEIILEKDIDFHSMCEHHFLPFFGKISIGYIPGNKIVGFGDIIKMIEAYAKRPQLQERLTEEIAETLYLGLEAQGVFVIIEATHTCMTMRGVKKVNSKIITTGTKGIFKDNDLKKIEILNLIRNS